VTSPDELTGGEPEAEEDNSPPVVGHRTVEVVTLALILAFAGVMAWDNWRTGAGWESTGPQAGYFPFYVAVILAAACIYGIVREILAVKPAGPFVTRNQLGRVMQVLGPAVAFVLVTQWLGLYVASFVLIAGFMKVVGKIRTWIAVVTAFAFTAAMFVTFEIAFDVIMPKGPLERLLGY
jgi:putative tricarboxylic transport membrane protein